MIIEDLKTDFYAQIKGERILILVNYDVDAICACKILQALLSSDNLMYSVVPVDFKDDLLVAYRDRRADERHVLLINCGGTIDLVDLLEPEDEIRFFVIDSHRPLDEANVYSDGQVRVFATSSDTNTIPAYDAIYRDDSEDEDSNIESEEMMNDIEAMLEKRQKRREWSDRRYEILVDYHRETYYSVSSATIIFDLAWKLSKDNFDLLWYAIVGVSEQLLLNKIEEHTYVLECGNLQNHINRLGHRGVGAPEDRGVSVNITFEKQLKLAMYRQWTIESSIIHSVLPATKLRLWTFDGMKRMHKMLAEIGIPLTQCRQRFNAMQPVYKQELQQSLATFGPRYGLDAIELASFVLYSGYRGAVGAMDAVHGLIGLLVTEKAKTERFLDALEALTRPKRERLDAGLDLCQRLLQTVFRISQNAIESGSIRNSKTFLYLVLQEDLPLMYHPYGILMLAQFVLHAYADLRRSTRVLPLLISAPYQVQEGQDADEALCHIASMPPLAAETSRTIFEQAFQRASEISQSEIIARYFDASAIILRVKDRPKFFDALSQLLT